jgi:hypothetical protein
MPFSNNTLANWIPEKFPNLRYYDARGNQFNLSQMETYSLDTLTTNSIVTAMCIKVDGDTLCGDCSIAVQMSGECHLYACANATALAEVTSTLTSYLEGSGDDVTPGGTMTILHTMRSCAFTTLLLVQYTNLHTAPRAVVNIADNLNNVTSYVLDSRARTKCPAGRMGATCNYFYELGWQRQAPTDGKGGYIYSADSGADDPADIFDNLLPQCLLPLNCGGNCTLAMRVVMYTCSDYLESLDDEDKDACQIAINAAGILCETDYNLCLRPVESQFNKIMDAAYANNLTVGPGQAVAAINVQVGTPVTSIPTRARATGGKVYATLISSDVTTSSRKRSGSMTLNLNIQFNVVADENALDSVTSDLTTYTTTSLASDSGLSIFFLFLFLFCFLFCLFPQPK